MHFFQRILKHKRQPTLDVKPTIWRQFVPIRKHKRPHVFVEDTWGAGQKTVRPPACCPRLYITTTSGTSTSTTTMGLVQHLSWGCPFDWGEIGEVIGRGLKKTTTTTNRPRGNHFQLHSGTNKKTTTKKGEKPAGVRGTLAGCCYSEPSEPNYKNASHVWEADSCSSFPLGTHAAV